MKTVTGRVMVLEMFISMILLLIVRGLLICRNAMLEKMGVKAPTARKTGTTIAGIVFKV